MFFNFSLTQKLSIFFLLPEGQLCCWHFSILTESRLNISAGFEKQSAGVQIEVSTNLYNDIQPEKRKPTVFFFTTRVRYLSILKIWLWRLKSIRFVFWRLMSLVFFVCNHTSVSGHFIFLHLTVKHYLKAFNSIWKRTFTTKQRSIFNQIARRQTTLVKPNYHIALIVKSAHQCEHDSQNYG